MQRFSTSETVFCTEIDSKKDFNIFLNVYLGGEGANLWKIINS